MEVFASGSRAGRHVTSCMWCLDMWNVLAYTLYMHCKSFSDNPGTFSACVRASDKYSKMVEQCLSLVRTRMSESLQLDRVHGDGASQMRVVLTAWFTDNTLKWHSARVMTLLGWSGQSRDKEPDAGFRTQLKGCWTSWFTTLAMPLEDHIGRSTKSLRASASSTGTATTTGEHHSWFSSTGLLVVLAMYIAAKHTTAVRKKQSQAVLETILQHCTRATVDDLCFFSVQAKTLCALAVDDENFCCHAREINSTDRRALMTRSSSIAVFLVALAARLHCPCCLHTFKTLVLNLSEELQLFRAEWSIGDGPQVPILQGPSGKRRRGLVDAEKTEVRVHGGASDDRYWQTQFMSLVVPCGEVIPELNRVGVDRSRFDVEKGAELRAAIHASSAHLLNPMGTAKRKTKHTKPNILEEDQLGRATNRTNIIVIDAQLQSVGLSLDLLRSKHRLRAIAAGETRQVLVPDRIIRLVRADGETSHETCLGDECFRDQYTWHVTLDEGPRTLPSMSLLQFLGLDMTAEGD
eukprot:2687202-Amphidinium_carterae.1